MRIDVTAWATLRASVALMHANASRAGGEHAAEFALKLVLDEMTTIELASEPADDAMLSDWQQEMLRTLESGGSVKITTPRFPGEAAMAAEQQAAMEELVSMGLARKSASGRYWAAARPLAAAGLKCVCGEPDSPHTIHSAEMCTTSAPSYRSPFGIHLPDPRPAGADNPSPPPPMTCDGCGKSWSPDHKCKEAV